MTREVRPGLLTTLCYAAMMCLAIGVNLLPVFLISIGVSFSGEQPLNRETLGRLGAVTFAGLVSGIVLTGPLADRFGAKPFVLLANPAFGNAGGILMPWIVGLVGDMHDLRWGLATSAIAPFLMLPLVGLLFMGALRTRTLLDA